MVAHDRDIYTCCLIGDLITRMCMLTASNISVRLGDLLLFDNVSFTINAGSRIGLVGVNGAGKSTLLRVLTGEPTLTSGTIHIDADVNVGYLRQGFADASEGTLQDVVDMAGNGLFAAMQELEASTTALGDMTTEPILTAHRFDQASDAFEALGGYQRVAEVESWLDRFGLGDILLDRLVGQLSGGQKTRAGLAALLASQPDLLILDEPTNHLDASGLAWLQRFLENYEGAFVLVSHDRGLLNATVTEILAIDPQMAAVRSISGTYSDYVATLAHERSEAEGAWNRQQVEVARITKDIRAAEQKARTIERSTIDFAIRKKAAKIARPAIVRKKKLEKQLASEDAAIRPDRSWGLSLDFESPQDGARDVVVIKDLSLAYSDQSILHDVTLTVRYGDRIAITGNNGSGKTSLLKAIIGELPSASGSVRIGSGVRIGYFSQEQETLDSRLTVLEQVSRIVSMSETQLRNELHKFQFGGDNVHKLVGNLSYGERARVMLAQLVLRNTTLLLLDEPLNHLDIDSRDSFEQALIAFKGTILVVLHDRYSIDRLATREWQIADGTVTEIFHSEVKS